MNNVISTKKRKPHWLFIPVLLAFILAILFYRSFLPEYVHFSNDGPLGQQNTAWLHLPAAFAGMWDDLNDVGFSAGSFAPNVTGMLKWLLGPVGYAKFYAPCALFIMGLGIWTLFRALKLSPLAITLGTLAAVLNTTFFAGATWGVASVEIAIGMNFLALALILANHNKTPWSVRWTRLSLAGCCVGMNVMEGADVGALCSILVAAFTCYKSLIEEDGNLLGKAVRGFSRVAVIAVFAGAMAFLTVVTLVGTSIQGVAGTTQDTETKTQHWDWATQWSLPKVETLSLFVPGLFGYKMDTPKDMMPQLQKAYQGGVYWGGVGRDPALDRYFDSGEKGTPPPSGFMRFTGGGNYCGILVWVVAIWAVTLSFRRQSLNFTPAQKKYIWFWLGVLFVSLLLSWGRFAPIFYGTLYQLPYFSTIRNPCKFLIFLSWALVILFAYGVHALGYQMDASKPKTAGLATHWTNWWTRASQFDRRWVLAGFTSMAVSLLGWLIFASQKPAFIQYLQKVGFPDAGSAAEIAAFSLGQVVWFLFLLAGALLLMTLAMTGYFSGPRAKLGAMLLGGFLIFDLGRADLPYIIHWDYKQKYEVGSLNPIVGFLREKPYEHRVAGLPFRAPEGMELLDQVYRIEWMQHHFPYYNIQCLDWIQMSRLAEDLKTYLEAVSPHGTPESVPLIARRWELANTRYLLGAAGYLDVLNQQLDPARHSFRIVQRFEIVPKPGIAQPTRLEELTAVPNENGRYALFEFGGALPRAKLYGNWQVNTNDEANLKLLSDLNFDPAKTVLISTPQKNLPALATNENSGTVEFKSYAPKQIILTANALTPSVLLLNDKYDPNWHVTVDGQPADLLRCNFLMRGVYLSAGQHTVEFNFSPPNKPLYVTIIAIAVGIILCGLLFFLTRKPTPFQP